MLKKSFWAYKLSGFVLILLFMLPSCSTKEGPSEDSIFFSFTDDLGRRVSLSSFPHSTAALTGSLAHMWLLSGGALCAAAEDTWEDFGFVSDTAINLGGAHSPDTELLFKASPDFVIASASVAENVEMLDLFEDTKLTVAYFDINNFSDYLRVMKIFTDITQKPLLYEKYGTDIKKEIDEIKDCLSQLQLSEEKKKVLVLRASSGSVKAKGSYGTVLGEILSDMGLYNIADSDSSILENLSVESIIRNEPYRIFVVPMGSDTEKAEENLKNLLLSNPGWSELSCVKENRIHFTDKTLFNLKPNDRWNEAYEIIFNIISEKN